MINQSPVTYYEHECSGAIPLAPSVNAAYSDGAPGKPRHASKALSEFKKIAAHALARVSYEYSRAPIQPGYVYRLTLACWFVDYQQIVTSDADGRIKAAQDAIMRAVGIDDRWIYDIHCIKAGIDPFYPHIDWTLDVIRGAMFGEDDPDLTHGLLAVPGRKEVAV